MTLQQILESAFLAINVPNLLLAGILLIGVWILRLAQAQPDFDIGSMLRDESGKPSSTRFAVFICLGLTSYLLAYVFIHKKVDDDTMFYMFLTYIVTWASSKSLEKLIDAWGGRRPTSPQRSTTPDQDQR